MYKLAALLPLLLGCISASVEEPSICDKESVPIAGLMPEAGTDFGNIVYSLNYDMSGDFTQVSSIGGEVTAKITTLSVTNSSGNLSWIKSMSASIQSTDNHTKYPPVVLSAYKADPYKPAGSVINLTPQIDGYTLYSYLNQGSITITATINGYAPYESPDLSTLICMSASIKVFQNL
jgi:hypothetical protein